MAKDETRRPVTSIAGRPRLTDTEKDLIRLAQEPLFPRWLEQITAIGGCAHPIYLAGHTTILEASTGAVLHHYDTTHEPGGRLAVRCRNRRETRCQPCSRLYAGDTFHLVRAGLLGGKGTPDSVAEHPRVFLTLTAPSFGPVHRAHRKGAPCTPRRNSATCEHGHRIGCGQTHADSDPLVGQPLCSTCYDYTGHVLWHAHAGELWNRTCRAIRRHLASAVGITQSRLGEYARVSFAKVAEYQRRGAIHFHAVIRLDGPDGSVSHPPHWATVELLIDVIDAVVRTTQVTAAYARGIGEPIFKWGTQFDVHEIWHAFKCDDAISDEAVAAYVAKYVTKSVGDAGGIDRPITSLGEISLLPLSRHVKTLMSSCWVLGGLPEFENLRLRSWAHTLGYRGHILTKSRAYSTTYAALRAQRAQYVGHMDATGTVTDAVWRYVGSGHSVAGVEIAAGIAADLAALREVRKEIADRGPCG
ncbi:replication initiator [Streptomyces odontomachi]|uniref:replication initiator n=1 Tax=Streptomyces odontomachi TaxID=2944940 RepID=UPI00210BA6B3|nr:replication initiator [Streptomyces sp. ODS25]